ncbi:hypothetical protein BKA63DRAFT_466624 [Paraphoma chrysanthemicola]|nr:hypothetical protein BKA63DRAFT_466624 [Paraphoma chrysanthemicola]
MGLFESKATDTTSASIERLYAARATQRNVGNSRTDAVHTGNQRNEDTDTSGVDGGNRARHSAHDTAINPARLEVHTVRSLRNSPVSSNAIEAATMHLTIAVRAMASNAEDAVNLAIAALKNIDARAVARAGVAWIMAHPWETATIVIPMILLYCTPLALVGVGFTAGGIAAGIIAAGLQASIGSVAAGSVFATLTSAAMGGFGVPIVLGSVWGISSAALWGLAAWKRWRGRDGDRKGQSGRRGGSDEGDN